MFASGAATDTKNAAEVQQPSCPLPPEIAPALRLLLSAADYAADAGGDPWQFAVELRDLQAAGLTHHDLRWLFAKGFVQHAQETTVPGDSARSFRPLSPTAAPRNTCLLLTDSGARHLRPYLNLLAPQSSLLRSRPDPRHQSVPPARCYDTPADPVPSGFPLGEGPAEGIATESYPDLSRMPPPSAPDTKRPEWDPNRRELRFRGQIVKRFRVPAPNQELILTAFQEEGWPEFIDDPLVPSFDQDPKRRLQATIKSLNRHQIAPLIRFHGNGNGTQIYWDPAPM